MNANEHPILFTILTICTLFTVGGLLPFFVLRVDRKPKDRCTDIGCDAFRYRRCEDGRCRYHCTMYCHCVSEADREVERVLGDMERKTKVR